VLDLVLKVVGALVLVALGVAYLRGWRRLAAAGHPPPRWRLALYTLALVTLALALLGLDEAAASRFSWHMIQHLLLVMVAAPLVLLGNPLPLVLWGLPRAVRGRLAAATLRPATSVRRALVTLSWLPVAGALYVITVWGWHLPAAYDAAAEHELVHVVEHAMLLGSALLFWWPVIRPAPRLRPPSHPGLVIAYLVAATAQNTALGMALTVPDRPFYPHYVSEAARLGISAVDDQAFGGGLMWSMGHMYLLPILVILYTLARESGRDHDDAPTDSAPNAPATHGGTIQPAAPGSPRSAPG
jgi:putative membrane protein